IGGRSSSPDRIPVSATTRDSPPWSGSFSSGAKRTTSEEPEDRLLPATPTPISASPAACEYGGISTDGRDVSAIGAPAGPPSAVAPTLVPEGPVLAIATEPVGTPGRLAPAAGDTSMAAPGSPDASAVTTTSASASSL